MTTQERDNVEARSDASLAEQMDALNIVAYVGILVLALTLLAAAVYG